MILARKYEIDFTNGPLLKKIILYALPIIGVNILQLLFTAADVTVLGIFSSNEVIDAAGTTKGDVAVAAVGATSQIINLLVGFFVGLSMGANVLVARAVGARDKERAAKLVGTSVLVSLIFGTVIMIVGILMSEQFLIWTKCAPGVLPYAKKYLQIYFLGMPVIMLYNFSASILRAVGDTVRPLIFLASSGVANVLLNIFFITVVGLDVEGVAIATVVSQLISAVGAIIIMMRSTGYSSLSWKYLKIDKSAFRDIFIIGFPMGLSKCTFALANVIIYSSINVLGEGVMAANSIAKEFDAFILETLHGFSLASLAVVSQNLGAKKPERIKRTIFLSLGLVTVVGVVMGAALYIFGTSLCGIITDTETVIQYCAVRIAIVGTPYLLCGILNVVQEGIRGLGYSNTALFISIFANIFYRLLWIMGVYPKLYVEGETIKNYAYVCAVWPSSWIVALMVSSVVLVILYRKVKNKINKENTEIEDKEKESLNVTG